MLFRALRVARHASSRALPPRGKAAATRDFDIVAVEEPFRMRSVAAQRFSVSRPPLATAQALCTDDVYEVELGFDFTPEEEADLVGFTNAL